MITWSFINNFYNLKSFQLKKIYQTNKFIQQYKSFLKSHLKNQQFLQKKQKFQKTKTKNKLKMQITDKDNNPLEGFAVEPITNCPHFKYEWADALKTDMKNKKSQFTQQKCKDCDNVGENWVCLQCLDIFCSRYVKEHMVKHNDQSKHPCALSFSDGSFWCYECDSYITNKQMDILRKIFAQVKFKKDEELESLFEQFENLQINDPNLPGNKPEESKNNEEEKKQDEEEEIKFTKEQLIDGIKTKKFKKVAFLTGAGLSVNAGIPDFRTPGTGLYSQLEKYNLPFPEAIFQLDFFKNNPDPFYTLAKEFLASGMSPTLSHYFIAEFEKQNQLQINLSQNIDGLEFNAGVPESKLVQAHGHFRTAHCVNKSCYKEFSMEEFRKSVETKEILKCECESYVKPDIVFFGEQLPNSFFKGIQKLQQADLVFVMGTSLKVQPFASLVDVVSEKVPLVLMNMENPGIERQNFLFLEGDLDDNSKQLMEAIGWEVPKVEKKKIQTNDNIAKSLDKDINK